MDSGHTIPLIPRRVLFGNPDEGHGFARPENWFSFNAIAEAFLARCLGGRYEPVGEDFKGSRLSVPAGAGAGGGARKSNVKRHSPCISHTYPSSRLGCTACALG